MKDSIYLEFSERLALYGESSSIQLISIPNIDIHKGLACDDRILIFVSSP